MKKTKSVILGVNDVFFRIASEIILFGLILENNEDKRFDLLTRIGKLVLIGL
jgi:hypothetical protein